MFLGVAKLDKTKSGWVKAPFSKVPCKINLEIDGLFYSMKMIIKVANSLEALHF